MSNTCRAVLRFLLSVLLLTQLIAASPLLVVRRVSPYLQTMEQLERLIDEEQTARDAVLRRHRKSIPDGYFNEFSVASDAILDRQRRGQPISDSFDEFSADPFEFPMRSLKKPGKQ